MKTMHADRRRVLALDIRPRRAGYAVFEGANRLLDVGLAVLRRRRDVKKRLKSLSNTYRPDVLVLRSVSRKSRRSHPETSFNLRTAQRLATDSAVTVVQINDKQIREHFGKGNACSKHEVASLVAHTFPELAHRLPPKRKLWQSERARMAIFDAVAYGMIYFVAFRPADG